MAKKKSATPVKKKKKSVKKEAGQKSPTSQLGSILSFCWLRKMIRNKIVALDPLDRWILTKNWISLFA